MANQEAMNTLFYFLSTVAQTFAGAYAILGTFAAFRLQLLRQQRREHIGIIKKRAKKVVDALKPKDSGERANIQDVPAAFNATRRYEGILRDANQEKTSALRTTFNDEAELRSESEQVGEETIVQIADEVEDMIDAKKVVQSLTTHEGDLRWWITRGLVPTGTTIILSLALLPFTRLLAKCWRLEACVYGLVGVFCLVTLCFIARTVLSSLRVT